MAEFSINTNAVKTTVDAEERLRKELADIQQAVREISGSLVIKTAASAGIKMRLNGLAGRVGNYRNSMGSMKNALERVAELYEETERSISGYADESVKSAETKKSESGSSFWDDIMGFMKGVMDAVGTAVGGIFSPITTIWGNMWQNSVGRIWKDMGAILREILGNGIIVDTPPHVGWLPIISGIFGNIWHPTPPGPTPWPESGNTPPSGTAGGSATENAAGGAPNVADSKVDYKNSVKQQIVHVVDENGNFRPPYSKYSAPGRYTFGWEADKMQCVGYAWGRMEELTGRPVNFSCEYAANIVNTYQRNGDLELVNDIGNIRTPALAVIDPGGNFGNGKVSPDYGHVVVVEAVYPNENGTYDIYFSEGNIPNQKDGTLSRVNSSDIVGCTGYVQLK